LRLKFNFSEETSVEDPKYTPTLEAWYASMLERDKSVFTLAGAGIAGVIAGFISLATSDAIKSAWWMIPGVISALFFLVAFWLSLVIFRNNASFLALTMSVDSPDAPKLDIASNQLAMKKDWATYSLVAGVIFAIGMGATATIERLVNIKSESISQIKEKEMANQGPNERQLIQNILNCSSSSDEEKFRKFEMAHRLPDPKPKSSDNKPKPVAESSCAESTVISNSTPSIATGESRDTRDEQPKKN
jgi:hypothetical protein